MSLEVDYDYAEAWHVQTPTRPLSAPTSSPQRLVPDDGLYVNQEERMSKGSNGKTVAKNGRASLQTIQLEEDDTYDEVVTIPTKPKLRQPIKSDSRSPPGQSQQSVLEEDEEDDTYDKVVTIPPKPKLRQPIKSDSRSPPGQNQQSEALLEEDEEDDTYDNPVFSIETKPNLRQPLKKQKSNPLTAKLDQSNATLEEDDDMYDDVDLTVSAKQQKPKSKRPIKRQKSDPTSHSGVPPLLRRKQRPLLQRTRPASESVEGTGIANQLQQIIREKRSLQLTEFVSKYSNSLPLQVTVEEGFYTNAEEGAVSTGDVFNVHFVKQTKVVYIMCRNDPRQTFVVPINSAVQFGILYNPHNSLSHALRGFNFATVSEIIATKTLPRVVQATKAHNSGNPNSSVEENEVLVIQGVNRPKVMGLPHLKVFSITKSERKKLQPQCAGHFTTNPFDVQLPLHVILQNIPDPFPLQAQMFIDSSFESLPQILQTEVVKLTHSSIETALVATTSLSHPTLALELRVSEEVLDLPVNLEIEISVNLLNEMEQEQLRVETRTLFNSFNPAKVKTFRPAFSSQVYLAQVYLISTVNRQCKMEGIEMQKPILAYRPERLSVGSLHLQAIEDEEAGYNTIPPHLPPRDEIAEPDNEPPPPIPPRENPRKTDTEPSSSPDLPPPDGPKDSETKSNSTSTPNQPPQIPDEPCTAKEKAPTAAMKLVSNRPSSDDKQRPSSSPKPAKKFKEGTHTRATQQGSKAETTESATKVPTTPKKAESHGTNAQSPADKVPTPTVKPSVSPPSNRNNVASQDVVRALKARLHPPPSVTARSPKQVKRQPAAIKDRKQSKKPPTTGDKPPLAPKPKLAAKPAKPVPLRPPIHEEPDQRYQPLSANTIATKQAAPEYYASLESPEAIEPSTIAYTPLFPPSRINGQSELQTSTGSVNNWSRHPVDDVTNLSDEVKALKESVQRMAEQVTAAENTSEILSSTLQAEFAKIVPKVDFLAKQQESMLAEIQNLKEKLHSHQQRESKVTMAMQQLPSPAVALEGSDEGSTAENKQLLASLGVKEVIWLLTALKLQQHESVFLRERIDGAVLVECDEEVLREELGVSLRLHRLKMLKLIGGQYSVRRLLAEQLPHS